MNDKPRKPLERRTPLQNKTPMSRTGIARKTPVRGAQPQGEPTPEARPRIEKPKVERPRIVKVDAVPKRRPKKALTLENDKIMSRICRRVGMCQALREPKFDSQGKSVKCHGNRNLQWCHIDSRKAHKVRWDARNCVCMCASCHSWYGDHPVAFGKFVEKIMPGTAEYLDLSSQVPFKSSQAFLESENERLKAEAERLMVDWRSPVQIE